MTIVTGGNGGIGLGIAVYPSLGNDLAARNGEDSWTLPMPGRFVIDATRIVRAVDIDPDYRYRLEPDKTVEDVKALKQPADRRRPAY